MSIRERGIATLAYAAGQTSRQRITLDAVYHAFRLSVKAGQIDCAQGTTGTGSTLVPGFPFSLMKNVRLVRNGSDYFFSATGEQLAKQHYYLNNAAPMARIYKVASNVETLRTASVRGVTVPANSQGIAANMGGFAFANAPSSTDTMYFDFQADILLQIPNIDQFFATLVDARGLSDFVIEIDWASGSDLVAITGTNASAPVPSFNLQLNSLDQDEVAADTNFGTFKRSQNVPVGLQYGSQNQQILLPKGNLLMDIIVETKAYKAGSAVNPISENDVFSQLNLRINTNFSLKNLTFQQFQANNLSDNGGSQSAWDLASGVPQGYCMIPLINASQSIKEALPTYSFDSLDIQASTQAIGSSSNGVTTSSTLPQVQLLIDEVIPGVSISKYAPQGAQAGSQSRTSARAYR